MVPSVRVIAERKQDFDIQLEEKILDIIEENPDINTRQIANEMQIPHTKPFRRL